MQIVLLASVNSALAEKRVALVIGNSHYVSTPVLGNPGNDATDVAAALTAVGFDVMLKLDATKREMDSGARLLSLDQKVSDVLQNADEAIDTRKVALNSSSSEESWSDWLENAE